MKSKLAAPTSRDARRAARARGKQPRHVALPIAPTEPLPAGKLSAWVLASRSAREQGRDVDVPCGACTACCRSSLFIHIRPDETDTLARIDPALLFPAPGAPPGHVLLGYDRQGRCPMLSDAGCSIYEHRPRTCRDFDCRAVAATGVALDAAQQAIAQQAQRWRFEHSGPEDDARQAALHAAAAFLRERGPELLPEALPSHPLQLAMLALRVYEVFYPRSGTAEEERPADAELARAILAAMTRGSAAADTAAATPSPARDRATSVKRASRARS